MQLLERNRELEILYEIAGEVHSGKGRVVYIYGEAGIGKTSLTEYFSANLNGNFNLLKGTCDALLTPRPLGPLFDIAFQTDQQLVRLLKDETNRSYIFSYFLEKIGQSSLPNLLILEDVHWADEATIDFIKFLGRRIPSSNTMLILTFRDEEVDASHPLKNAVSEIPSENLVRINLKPLSKASISQLLSTNSQYAEDIFNITQGNPFYITEMLACEEQKIPNSVSDAVMARINKLSPVSIEFLQAVSVAPTKAELWLLEELFLNKWDCVDECFSRKILTQESGYIKFRHELARMAVEEFIPYNKKKSIHKRILTILLNHTNSSSDYARIVHHAKYAGDAGVVLEFAPKAAHQAISFGAHWQAAHHYETAMEFCEYMDREALAILLGKYAYECYLIEKIDEAFEHGNRGLEIWKELGNEDKVGSCYRFLSRLYWLSGNKDLAEEYGNKAMSVLSKYPPGRESVMAISNISQLKMLENNYSEAIELSNQAIKMANELSDKEILAHALNNLGTAQVMSKNKIGKDINNLLESLRISLEHNYEEHAARAYTNIAYVYLIHKDYKNSDRYLKEGIEYTDKRDLESWEHYLKTLLAQQYFEQGHWMLTEKLTSQLLNQRYVKTITRIPLLSVLGGLYLRQGKPSAREILDEAFELAIQTKESQRILNVAEGKAELAWLEGDLGLCKRTVDDALKLVQGRHSPVEFSELVFWSWISGETIADSSSLFEPYRYLFSGNWKKSSELWREMGCPYEEALALMFGDEKGMRQGLKILEKLNAQPLINKYRQEMRSKGIKNIAMGPRKSTIENPAFLTNRQIEVLCLISDGLKNQEIADKLFISTKTVDHHISAILSKLNVDTRSKAVVEAKSLGIL